MVFAGQVLLFLLYPAVTPPLTGDKMAGSLQRDMKNIRADKH